MWGALAVAGSSILGDMMKGKGASDASGDYSKGLQEAIDRMEQGEKQGIGYLSPYQDYGLKSISNEFPTLQQMVNDPAGMRQKLMSGYDQSPEMKLQLQTGTDAANKAASASGMIGSSAQKAALQKYGQQLSAADQGNYLQQQEGLLNTGLAGESQLGSQGLGAGTSIANLIAQISGSEATALAGQGAARAGADKASGNMWGNVMGDMGGSLSKIL